MILVKLLSIRNVQNFKPMALDLKKSEFKYELKRDLDSIIIQLNPIKDKMDELFSDNDTIRVLGIQSEFIESLEDDKYQCDNIGDKWKQTKLAKQFRSIFNHFQVLLFGAKQPAWSLFEQIEFDTIFIEISQEYGTNAQYHSSMQEI